MKPKFVATNVNMLYCMKKVNASWLKDPMIVLTARLNSALIVMHLLILNLHVRMPEVIDFIIKQIDSSKISWKI